MIHLFVTLKIRFFKTVHSNPIVSNNSTYSIESDIIEINGIDLKRNDKINLD